MLHIIDIGDSLWAFARRSDGQYVLAAQLVVRAKTLNPPNFRYGRYRVWGDLFRSRYFQVDGQPSTEQIIRSLSIKANAPVLGASFQGGAAARTITTADHRILAATARDLPLEPCARILPEERLEAALLLGDRTAVEVLVRREPVGIAEARREYLYRQAPVRGRQLVRNTSLA